MVLTVIGTGLAVTMALSSAIDRQGSEIKADLARAEERWYTVSQKVAAHEAVVGLRTPPPPPKYLAPSQHSQPLMVLPAGA
ncbi:hypothetical protein HXX76_013283 [Chlamydomonas incerta]|uniref:Secreted protein n=1 Tax=Chlamydomonas incerta TaxID=51695 RepID=A0A835SSZ7_CHLIN|nr:hypothetical protein HXX76_013283 [Chlamydomonas incerta]|eukprot:KAG2426095.1 hypothetical protein HXX76_013283 [Chlamydomonas incerta]